jgi:hypothetical protein
MPHPSQYTWFDGYGKSGKEQKSWSSRLRNFLQIPVTSFVLRPYKRAPQHPILEHPQAMYLP